MNISYLVAVKMCILSYSKQFELGVMTHAYNPESGAETGRVEVG